LQTLDSLTFCNSTPIFGKTNGMNFPSWSISAEMIAYVVFGVIMFAQKRFRITLSISLIIGAIFFMIFKNQYLLTGDFGFVRGIYCFLIEYFTLLFYQSKERTTSAFEIPLLTIPWVFGF